MMVTMATQPPLLETNLAETERALGTDHPFAETARTKLAEAIAERGTDD